MSGRWHAGARVGAYQLIRNGDSVGGLGDLALEVRMAAVERPLGGLRAGALLTTTLPTASNAGLGMGHAMAMPGLWLTRQGEVVSIGGIVSYGRAVDSSDGHHHGSGSIVDPMNPSELLASSRVGWRIAQHLRVDASLSYARPIFQAGEDRGIAGAAVVVPTNLVQFSAAMQVPIVGDQFRLRALLGATFTL
jgi:hypothetical protein